MGSRLFRAREIRQGANEDELRRQLNEAFKLIERDLGEALSSSKMSEVITASTCAPAFGEVVRVAPPSGGLSLILPEPNLARLDARITVVQEAASGAMTVEVVNGTINGAATLAFLAGVGTVELILTPTGWYGWSVSLVASLPITGLAAQPANTLLANPTGSTAVMVAHPLSTLAGAGLAYASGALAVGAGTGITVNANDVAVTTPLTDGDKGDITVATNGTAWSIDANAVTNAKSAQMAAATLKLRALGSGVGDPIDGTGAQAADILESEAFDWSGAHQFTGRVRWNGPFSQTLTGNTDNLVIGAANVVRLVGAGFNLTGMAPDVAQQLVWLQNADSAANLVLVHNATSTAANRFFLPNNANYTMTPRSAVWARYDSGDSRWYIAPGSA